MTFLKTYIKLVRFYKQRDLNDATYTEKHHYFPKSIFGDNNKVVVVTYREHFVLHRLLAKICEKRYGKQHAYTQKMNMAIHRMVYGSKKDHLNVNSRYFEIAKKADKDAKIGKSRPDMTGKKYFGADEETIAKLKQKVSKTRTGMKINYPKTRKPLSNRTQEVFDKISQSRQKTDDKYKLMTNEQFDIWIKSQELFTRNKTRKSRPNPNVTHALKVRGIPYNRYYNESDFSENFLKKKK